MGFFVIKIYNIEHFCCIFFFFSIYLKYLSHALFYIILYLTFVRNTPVNTTNTEQSLNEGNHIMLRRSVPGL
jgi:hypothetical protein